MRIVHVVSYFQPKLGYQEYYLALNQMKLNHEVVVITSERYYPFSYYNNIYHDILGDRLSPKVGFQNERGVPTLRLPVLAEYRPLVLVKGLKKAIKNFTPDVVQVHGVFTPLLQQVCRIDGVRIIADEHMVPFLHTSSGYVDKALKKLFVSVHRRFFWEKIEEKLHNFFVTKEEVRQYFLQISRKFKHIPVFPLGVDLNIFNPERFKNQSTKEELGFDKNTFILFYSGKIIPGKGINILFSLLEALSRRYDVGLLLVGDGPKWFTRKLQMNADREINAKTRKISLVTQSSLSKYMMVGNIGCWLGRPSASINEMIAMGKPVLVKSFEGEDLVQSGYRFIRKYSSLEDDIKWVSSLIEDQKFYSKVQSDAWEYSKTNLDWMIITKKITQLYSNTEM